MKTKQVRGKYTQEFKLEAVRLVKGGQSAAVVAKVLGIAKANVSNWVRLSDAGKLTGAGDKPVTAEQMERCSGFAMQELDDEALGWFSRRLRASCCGVGGGL